MYNICDHIQLSSSQNEKFFRQKLQRKSKQPFCVQYFFSENRPVYEIMLENIVEWGRQQMTIWHMRIPCCTPKATNTHSEYVILIPFPLQQWLHESTSLLHYTALPVLVDTEVLISPQPDQKRNKLQRQKILSFIYPIYNHNWRKISTIYIYNKTSIKRNILTIKQNTSGSRSC